MADESEYTAEPQRRRLVTQTWQGPGPVHDGYWNIGRKATRADVEAWARVRAPEWLESRDAEASTDQRIMGGQLVFAGTRIPVDTLWPYFRDGASTAVIAEEYPELGAAQIDEARSTYESAVWVHRWGGDIPDTEEPGDSEALDCDPVSVDRVVTERDAAIKRAEKAEGSLTDLRAQIDTWLAGMSPGPEAADPHRHRVQAAAEEIQRQVDAARDAEDERDRAVERAKVAEADRAALLRVAQAAGATHGSVVTSCTICQAIDALPEHIMREL